MWGLKEIKEAALQVFCSAFRQLQFQKRELGTTKEPRSLTTAARELPSDLS